MARRWRGSDDRVELRWVQGERLVRMEDHVRVARLLAQPGEQLLVPKTAAVKLQRQRGGANDAHAQGLVFVLGEVHEIDQHLLQRLRRTKKR